MGSSLPYQLLIFDWDGTLMDSVARIVDCLRKASEQVLNHENRSDDELKDVIGLGLHEALTQLHPQANTLQIKKMADAYRHQYMNINTTRSKLFKGAEHTLTLLKQQNFQLAIATGKSRQGLNHTLEITGLSHCFDITRSASETQSKPHPKMLEEILNEASLKATNALMIGDTVYDMEMAKNANMDRLGVSYGVHSKSRLMKYDPIGCINDIKQLNHFLQKYKTIP